jgi:WD40 repeat protein
VVFSSPLGQLLDKVTVKSKIVDCKQFNPDGLCWPTCNLSLSFEDGTMALYSFDIQETFFDKKARSESNSSNVVGDAAAAAAAAAAGIRRPRSSSNASTSLAGASRNIYKLSFPSSYGKSIACEWLDPNHLVIGFANGTIVLLSVDMESLGQEKGRVRYLRRSLQQMVCDSRDRQVLATSGDDGNIQIFDVENWNLFSFQKIPEEVGRINDIAFSRRTNTLSVSTESGTVLNYTFPRPKLVQTSLALKHRADIAKLLALPLNPVTFCLALALASLFLLNSMALYFSTDISVIACAIANQVDIRKSAHWRML